MKLAACALLMLIPSIASAESNVFKCSLDYVSRNGADRAGDEIIVGASSVEIVMVSGMGFGNYANDCDTLGQQILCKNYQGNITLSYNKDESKFYYVENLSITGEKITKEWSCAPFHLKNYYKDIVK